MKKDGDMTIGTIIAIVLGVAVLVFLIFGFSSGWDALWSNVVNIGNTETNIDEISTACDIACSTSSTYSYCTQKRTITYENGTSVVGSCNDYEKLLGVSCSLDCDD